MNLIKTLFQRQPEPAQPLRYVAATKRENLAAERRRNDKRLELEVMKLHTDPDKWAAAVQRGATVKFETPSERFKRLERDIFKGMRVSRDGLGKA
jgi:hypothetical protein